MTTKVVYFTVGGKPEQAEFSSDFPADEIKGSPKSRHVYMYIFLPSLKDCYEQLCVTGVTLMQILFYSSGSFIHNTNCNCMILEGNLY